MRYDHIQPLAFPIDPERLRDISRPYQVCEFPRTWRGRLVDFFYPDHRANQGERRGGVPLSAITRAFATLLPDVIAHRASGRGMWLAAAYRPDDEALQALIHGGLIATAQEWQRKHPQRPIDIEGLPELLAGIDVSALDWQVREPLPDPGHAAGDETFKLLPHLIAAHLAGGGWTVEHGRSGTSSFARATSDNGAELVSWPPHYHRRAKYTWPWSFIVRFNVQTLPFDPTPYLFVRVGVRRYAGKKVFLKSNDRDLSVAIKAPAPWYDGQLPPVFGRATVRWRPGPKETKGGRMDWTDDIVAVLNRLHGAYELPSAADLCADPIPHLNGDDDHVAAVFYRTGYRYKHPVGDGASAKDRWRIFSQLSHALRPHLDLVAPAERVLVDVPRRPPVKKKDGIRISASQLTAAVGSRIDVEVWYQTRAMRKEAFEALARTLQLPALVALGDTDGERWETATSELYLSVRAAALNELAGPMVVDGDIRNPADQAREASTRRINQVTGWLKPDPAGDRIVFTLVELEDADAFSTQTDPKHATRVAAGRARRITQFFTPDKPNEKPNDRRLRVEQAVRDLLARQTGMSSPGFPLGLADAPLPPNTRIVGLWAIRKNGVGNAAYPVAVCWDPAEPVIKILLPQTARKWRPLPEGLLALTKLKGNQALLDDENTLNFIDALLDQLGALSGSTLLLTHAQNLRSRWKNLANTRLNPNDLARASTTADPISRYQGLRHIRVRTNPGGETPQHYAMDADNIGISAGLWRSPSNDLIFYSTPDKPATASTSSPKGSKLEPRWSRPRNSENSSRLVVDISSDVWNPQLVEFAVAGLQDGDVPAAWAAAAHQTRYLASHHDDATVLPHVLHLARLAGQYLLPAHQLDDDIEVTDG
jgi:RNaseH domain of pPIWI_RE/pPIWI_RE module N-terminal domain/MID domain of pPIWI_RE